MAKVIFIGSKKGGTSKTTISINLAAALVLRGFKVILIDSDTGNDSASMWCEVNEGKYFPVTTTTPDSLKTLVRSLSETFDYIVIDGAPEADSPTAAAIRISDLVVITCQPSLLDLRRNQAIARLVCELDDRFETETIAKWMLTRCQRGTKIIEKTIAKIGETEIPLMFNSGTTELVAYKEAFEFCATVFDADDSISNIEQARQQINTIADEILEVLHEGE